MAIRYFIVYSLSLHVGGLKPFRCLSNKLYLYNKFKNGSTILISQIVIIYDGIMTIDCTTRTDIIMVPEGGDYCNVNSSKISIKPPSFYTDMYNKDY